MSINIGTTDNLKGRIGEFIARGETRIQNICYIYIIIRGGYENSLLNEKKNLIRNRAQS